jgi:hypothetical protein
MAIINQHKRGGYYIRTHNPRYKKVKLQGIVVIYGYYGFYKCTDIMILFPKRIYLHAN